jgi:hypothetical protein
MFASVKTLAPRARLYRGCAAPILFMNLMPFHGEFKPVLTGSSERRARVVNRPDLVLKGS